MDSRARRGEPLKERAAPRDGAQAKVSEDGLNRNDR